MKLLLLGIAVILFGLSIILTFSADGLGYSQFTKIGFFISIVGLIISLVGFSIQKK